MRLDKVSLEIPRWKHKGIHFPWPCHCIIAQSSGILPWSLRLQVVPWKVKVCAWMPECLRTKKTWAPLSSEMVLCGLASIRPQTDGLDLGYFVSPALWLSEAAGTGSDHVKSASILAGSWALQRWLTGSYALGAQGCPGFDGHPGLWLFLNQAGKNYSWWTVCKYEIRGRLLRSWILLHIVLYGNIIVNLNFLLTWQRKGAVSFHTQAFTGAGVSIRDQ